MPCETKKEWQTQGAPPGAKHQSPQFHRQFNCRLVIQTWSKCWTFVLLRLRRFTTISQSIAFPDSQMPKHPLLQCPWLAALVVALVGFSLSGRILKAYLLRKDLQFTQAAGRLLPNIVICYFPPKRFRSYITGLGGISDQNCLVLSREWGNGSL